MGPLLAFAAALLLTAAGLAGAGEAAGGRPHVSLAGRAPVKVRGDGFGAAERVTVRVAVGTRVRSHQVTARADGSFVAVFGDLSIGADARPAITAKGPRSGLVQAVLAKVGYGPR